MRSSKTGWLRLKRTTAAEFPMQWRSPSCAATARWLRFGRHRGLTLRALAEETGIAASYLSEIERGRKPGSAAALARIAGALDTTVDSPAE